MNSTQEIVWGENVAYSLVTLLLVITQSDVLSESEGVLT